MDPLSNISPDWTGSTRAERRTIKAILEREATPGAIRYFARHSRKLGDYWYWFVLGTLWVSYTGHSDLATWRKCFCASRRNRSSSLMKPDELALYHQLPDVVTAYRAHRPGEIDWLSYTLDPRIAVRFAFERGVPEIKEWAIEKTDVLALFTRRGEQEILVLDPGKATLIQTIDIVVQEDHAYGN